MRKEGRGGPGRPGDTGQPRSRGMRLGWGKPLEVQCSLGRKKQRVWWRQRPQIGRGVWFPGGPKGSQLISKRRANYSTATRKVKGQQGHCRCQQAKGQLWERAVGGLLCLWVSLISEPLWPGTEPWVPMGSCLFKQN